MDRRQADGSRAWVDLPLWQAQTPACEQACPFGKTTGQRGEQAGRWPGIDCTHALPEARSRFPACTTKGQAPAYHPRGQAHGCAAGRWPSLRDPSFRDSTRTAPHPHPASLALGHSRPTACRGRLSPPAEESGQLLPPLLMSGGRGEGRGSNGKAFTPRECGLPLTIA